MPRVNEPVPWRLLSFYQVIERYRLSIVACQLIRIEEDTSMAGRHCQITPIWPYSLQLSALLPLSRVQNGFIIKRKELRRSFHHRGKTFLCQLCAREPISHGVTIICTIIRKIYFGRAKSCQIPHIRRPRVSTSDPLDITRRCNIQFWVLTPDYGYY